MHLNMWKTTSKLRKKWHSFEKHCLGFLEFFFFLRDNFRVFLSRNCIISHHISFSSFIPATFFVMVECLIYAPKHVKTTSKLRKKNNAVLKTVSQIPWHFSFSCVPILGYLWGEIAKSDTTFPSPVLSKLQFLYRLKVFFRTINIWNTTSKCCKKQCSFEKQCYGFLEISFLLGWQFLGISELKLPNLAQYSFLQFCLEIFLFDCMFECCTKHVTQNTVKTM